MTPDKTFFDGEVDSLVVPGLDGYYGILAEHAPMVSGISAGILRMVRDGSDEYMVVGEGILRIENKIVRLLVDAVIETAGYSEAELKLEEYLKVHPAQAPGPAI